MIASASNFVNFFVEIANTNIGLTTKICYTSMDVVEAVYEGVIKNSPILSGFRDNCKITKVVTSSFKTGRSVVDWFITVKLVYEAPHWQNAVRSFFFMLGISAGLTDVFELAGRVGIVFGPNLMLLQKVNLYAFILFEMHKVYCLWQYHGTNDVNKQLAFIDLGFNITLLGLGFLKYMESSSYLPLAATAVFLQAYGEYNKKAYPGEKYSYSEQVMLPQATMTPPSA